MKEPRETSSIRIGSMAPTGAAAAETLHAIVLGGAGALAIEAEDGPRVYTLRDAGEPYRALVEPMPGAATVLDAEHTVLYCNGALARMLGRGELACLDFLDLVAPAQRGLARALLAAGLEAQAAAELALIAADGAPSRVRASVGPIAFDGRPCVALVVTALDDIEALKIASADLRESERRFQTALANSPVTVFENDSELRYTWIYNSNLGFKAEDAIGKTDTEILDPRCAAEVTAIKRRAIETGLPSRQEVAAAVPGEPLRYFDLYVEPRHDQSGAVVGVSCAATDIDALKWTQGAVAAAKAEAERANLAKSKFLASVSHDLRQPAQSLVLLLSLLRRKTAGDSGLVEIVRAMESAVGGLNVLLTGILDISRLDSGVVAPEMQPVDLGPLIEQIGEEYRERASKKGLRLRAAPRAVWASSDPALLERALRSLVENALTYTRKGGLLIGARIRGERARIDVVDTGIGVPADQLQHIFNELYQVDNPGRVPEQGLGLGLAIASRIAALLGGEVQVASRVGRGSRFSLLLPLDRDEIATAPPEPESGGFRGRVLLIEDNTIVRFSVASLLEAWGCAAISAASGEEALDRAAAEDWRFDAVIADYRLGGPLSGVAAAKEIERRAGRAVPTIVLTGDTAMERISELNASGYVVLHKPVDAESLRGAPERLLGGR